jgi:uncharacterized protein (TIGR03435 family)
MRGEKSEGPPPGGVALPVDPGGLTLFEAIEKQLGLKLDVTKKPMAVMVIDKISQMPTEN